MAVEMIAENLQVKPELIPFHVPTPLFSGVVHAVPQTFCIIVSGASIQYGLTFGGSFTDISPGAKIIGGFIKATADTEILIKRTGFTKLENYSPYGNRIIADGASNYWRLDETSGTVARDIIGGANGTISGGVTLGGFGALTDGNKAMTWGGDTGVITIPAFSVGGTGPITLECWLKGITPNQAAMYIIDNKVASTVAAGVQIFGDSNSLYFSVGNGTARWDVFIPVPWFSDWHHVVGVLERGGSDIIRLYIDGVLRNSNTLPATGWNVTSNQSLCFGTYPGDSATSDNHYLGSIDEVAIYRRALTPADVLAHYNLGKG